jgi:peptidylprolyl isomerase
MVPIIRLAFCAWLFTIAAHAQSDTITTKSGLKYIRLKEGTGAIVKKGQKLKVNYKGKFTNGAVFDFDNNFAFKLGEEGFIQAWNEGFALMKKGEKGKFIVKPELGYGDMPFKNEDGEVIVPANSVLIFEVEILDAK